MPATKTLLAKLFGPVRRTRGPSPAGSPLTERSMAPLASAYGTFTDSVCPAVMVCRSCNTLDAYRALEKCTVKPLTLYSPGARFSIVVVWVTCCEKAFGPETVIDAGAVPGRPLTVTT